MFSGLVEATSPVLSAEPSESLIRLALKRPDCFSSLKEGESFSANGVCLTLEEFDKEKMIFSLAPETLKITGWTAEKLEGEIFNLERSLSLQSLVGGHLVTGHIDGLALLKKTEKRGKSLLAQIEIPKKLKSLVWEKGYIALNGVSLTVNKARGRKAEICLVPKTLELTNLSFAKEGDLLNFEADYMARAYISAFKSFKRA